MFSDKPFKFELTFRLAENHPVDLYYVVDLSKSMAEDKAKLADLGDLLSKSEMQFCFMLHLWVTTH